MAVPAELIAEVRRFNRTVTAHVGALEDRFLGRDRPLGEARLLWEIGPDGCSVRALRARLELDSGYVSRLLRSLESAGLVTVAPAETDRRTRIVRLTADGLRERELLDARSDAAAASLLAPLSAAQQADLARAMRTVEGLLTAGIVDVRVVDPEHEDARRCLEAYYAELDRREHGRFDPAAGSTATPVELRPPRGVLLVAYLHGEPVACGALKHHPGGVSDVKRMWVADAVRGLGMGRRLLIELEQLAVEHGDRAVRLETNRRLTEAIALYRSAGYVEVAAFNDEPYADHWFSKPL